MQRQALVADNRELASAARVTGGSSPAGEWLLDNYYLIEEQVLLVKEDLPADYGIELPRLVGGEWDGFPRIYEALLDVVAHTDSRIDEEYLLRFVDGYQEVAPLTIGEVWAVPIMLRIALVENLSRLSRAVVLSMRAEKAADQLGRAPGARRAGRLRRPCRRFSHRSTPRPSDVPPAFFVRLTQRLGELETGGEAVNAWLERRLSAEGIVLETAAADAQQEQAANQVSIANAITSIRLLDALDWREFFERVSIAEAILREDPAQTYAVMDFASRDRYRHSLEIIARRSTDSEIEVAEKIVALAREALAIDASDDVRGHVGWWLMAEGRLRARAARRLPPPEARDPLPRASRQPRALLLGGVRGVLGGVARAPGALRAGRGRRRRAGRRARAAGGHPALRARGPVREPALRGRVPPAHPAQARLAAARRRRAPHARRRPRAALLGAVDPGGHREPRDRLPRQPRRQRRLRAARRPEGVGPSPPGPTTA